MHDLTRGVFKAGATIHVTDDVVYTTEADEAVESSVFVQIMGLDLPLKKLLVGVILLIFGHFASSDFKVWLRSC